MGLSLTFWSSNFQLLYCEIRECVATVFNDYKLNVLFNSSSKSGFPNNMK